MGSGLSKVSCGDAHLYRKYCYKTTRPKIDKSKIGIPTDFRHTYHVGNDTPFVQEIMDPVEPSHILTDTKFLATMAQITDALKQYPLKSDEKSMSTASQTEAEEQIKGGYYNFSSCLTSRIDAQIVELARARSKNKRSPVRDNNDNLICDKPTIMI